MAYQPQYVPQSVIGSVFTYPQTNQSVSGAVNVTSTIGIGNTPSISGRVDTSIVGMLPGGTNVLGSVATLQGTNPWNVAGSVVARNITPSSLLTGSSIFGQLPAGTAVLGSVAVLQGTNPWNISSVYGNVSGSVVSHQGGTRISSLVSTVPSSVLVGASIFGQAPVFIVGGSVATATTNSSVMLLNGAGIIGSVTTLQGTNPWLTQNSQSGTVISSLVNTLPSSVQVGASVMGHAPVFIIGGSVATATTNSSVMLLNGANVIGSVTTLQGTNPWLTQNSQSGTVISSLVNTLPSSVQVGASVMGHAPVFIIGGSVATATTNSSVQLLNSPNTVGSVVILQGTNPLIITGSVQGAGAGTQYAEDDVATSVTGTAIMFRVSQSSSLMDVVNPLSPLPIIGSVSGRVDTSMVGMLPGGTNVLGSIAALQGTLPWNIAGSVTAAQIGTRISSVVNSTPSSLLTGSSIFGQLPAGTAVLGSVAVLQGTNPWNISSVYGNISGSVIAVQSGTRMTSVVSANPSSMLVGASIFGQLPAGTAVLGSVATLQGTNPWAISFTPSSVVSGHASIVSAVSVQVLAAPGASLFNYVTDFLLSNTGATTTLVTFTDGDGSVMGKSIAPTAGGAIAASLSTPMKTLAANKVVNIVAANATSVLHVWIGGYKST